MEYKGSQVDGAVNYLSTNDSVRRVHYNTNIII